MVCLLYLLVTLLFSNVVSISTISSTLPVFENSTNTQLMYISPTPPLSKDSFQDLNVLKTKNRTTNENGENYTPIYNKSDTSFNSEEKSPFIRKNITIGYLTTLRGNVRRREGLLISGAITMALDEINQDSSILPNVQLVLKWNDTTGNTLVATRAMTDMICEGVSAFFGPEGSCYLEAMVAQSNNIPMFGYKCSDYRTSQIPTFVRTELSDTQVTKSIVSLLTYYKWKKFSIIYEEGFYTVAQSLVQEARINNMSINDEKKAIGQYECCLDQLSCCESGLYQLIKDTKNRTRIYVFLGSSTSLRDFMLAMQEDLLFENGEYFVIYADNNNYLEKNTVQYIWNPSIVGKDDTCEKNGFDGLLKRGRSLFVIVPTAPNEYYETFSNIVSLYNSREPFNFYTSSNFYLTSFKPHVSIYAAYLYDSVKLYARALDTLLSKEPFLSDQIINKIASNGTKIVETIIEAKTYQSITGAAIIIDRNGDSEGNFSVLAFQEVRGNQRVYGNFSCPFQMRPIGQFYQEGDNAVKYRVTAKLEWAGLGRPNDEPTCGFYNEFCPKSYAYNYSLIAGTVVTILLLCAGVVTICIYRKWKIEKEIEGLLWKIDRNEISSYFEQDIVSNHSLSLISVSVTSYKSRVGLHIFATTAQYKGVVVRLKQITLSRKKCVSRAVMKEMRLLRELKHDNINSFIGACVEPAFLLLVTDYCAKGSLYDIIENEDFKLDSMFIASLVHDLIKGMLHIHSSPLVCHGNLKSSNCVVTSRWVLQVTDFGLIELRCCSDNDSIGEHEYYRNLFWKAPEILRNPNLYCRGTQKGDVYAFAIILYEILGRRGPFGITDHEPKDIIEMVKRKPFDEDESFRPDIELLSDCEISCDDILIQCMKDCWAEIPEDRPDFAAIRNKLRKMKDGKNKNITDQMMNMMITYANNLEEIVTERTRLLHEEKSKTENLLHRMLPSPVIERLTGGLGVEPEFFDSVTIYFSNIVDFTAMSAESTPSQVVNFLNDVYIVFDRIIKQYDVYKVETIADAYMVVSGLFLQNNNRHAGEIASMALDLLDAVKNQSTSDRQKEILKLRIGIHTGPVVAGVVGLTMPRYCLFGDTVNTVFCMENCGEPLKIHISFQCKEVLDKLGGYIIEERGLIKMKSKDEVQTFWLMGATEQAVQKRQVDIRDTSPLFYRSRRKFRQVSIGGKFQDMDSHQHFKIPRDTHIKSEKSSLQNASPVPSRHVEVNCHHSQVPKEDSSEFETQMFENINASQEDLKKCQILSNNSSSFDENCEECSEIQLTDIFENKSRNNSFLDSDITNISPEEHNCIEGIQVPFVNEAQDSVMQKPSGSGISDTLQNNALKRWSSLESSVCDSATCIQSRKKPSIKSWILGLFNGSGLLKTTSTSLRTGIINENNLSEKESIV